MNKNNLFRKFITYAYGSVIGLGIGFATTMLSTRLLDPIEFGKSSIFLLFMNVVTIFIILGTDQTYMRFYHEEHPEKRGKLLLNVVKIPLMLTMIISVLFLVFYKEISLLIFEESSIKVVIAVIIGYTAQSALRFGNIVIRMNQKGNLFSIIEILKRVLQLILILFLYLIMGATYEIIIYSTIVSFIVLFFVTVLFERESWSLKALKIKQTKHSKNEIIKYSFPLAVTVFITWIFQSFDQIALRQWSSFEELGLYSAAYKIIALLTVIQVAFSTFWTPICYEKFEKKPEDTFFFSITTNVVSLIMFTIGILVIMLKDYIVLLLGSDFYKSSDIIPYLVFIPIMYTISETTVMGINFYKKTKWHIIIATISLLINILLNYILIPSYGAVGAAVGTSLSYVLFFVLRTFVSLRYYKIHFELNKLLIMTLSLFFYAFYVTNTLNASILIGVVLLFLNITLFKRDILHIFKNKQKKGILNE